MKKPLIRRIKFLFLIALWFMPVVAAEADVSIAYRTESPQLSFAVSRLDQALRQVNETLVLTDLAGPGESDILIAADEREAIFLPGAALESSILSRIEPEGFQIARRHAAKKDVVCVIARDETGAMYGVLDLAEQIRTVKGLEKIEEKLSNRRFEFRAIKFNLPWSSYRPESNPAMNLHIETCRDLNFWRRFLDMMAQNRFNVLSLWNLHPFTYMIRPEGFGEACPFSDKELARWQRFWRRLFRMAKEHGIETYVVNWNIVVSPEFAKAHGLKERNDTSDLVRRYTRQCVRQVIDEYDELTGLGVTLADWMNNMTPKEREDWIQDTFVEGMNQAKRRAKFIHRSVLAGSPVEMRRVIDEADFPDPVWVEVKFNWSHGHSTPRLAITHDYSSGQIDERFWKPAPENYRIAWMIRNEDFFILRWGQPDFIRQHIVTNGLDYVGGYFVGSEGYIPAKEYAHKPNDHVTWRYAFQKQWLFYMLWGRLLYEPDTPDEVFAAEFDHRYGDGTGQTLLKAYALAGRMPLRLASFHRATWDYTLYSEGFLAPAQTGFNDKVSPFISIDELIRHETLDPAYLSIADYVEAVVGKQSIEESLVTPLELAEALESDGGEALKLASSLTAKVGQGSPTLACEIADVQAWAHLSLYFADKLRAGVALETFRKTAVGEQRWKAVALLKKAAEHWADIVAVTNPHYRAIPAVQLSRSGSGDEAVFSWRQYQNQTQRDIQIAAGAE
ncbi:MAG: hypothetical protein JSW66_03675 [Phycisphaerales bacterium]|nr:MAG: hypothetical protein JSW66_03675 [Phycisphaerales bacterium]